MKRANLGRQAKIIATLGPASSSVTMIAALIEAGMNVARINMSHGNHDRHAALIKNIREASRRSAGDRRLCPRRSRRRARRRRVRGPGCRHGRGRKWRRSLLTGRGTAGCSRACVVLRQAGSERSRFAPTRRAAGTGAGAGAHRRSRSHIRAHTDAGNCPGSGGRAATGRRSAGRIRASGVRLAADCGARRLRPGVSPGGTADWMRAAEDSPSLRVSRPPSSWAARSALPPGCFLESASAARRPSPCRWACSGCRRPPAMTRRPQSRSW